jgi:hypothetical protein
MSGDFFNRLTVLEKKQELLLSQSNQKAEAGKGYLTAIRFCIDSRTYTYSGGMI